MASLNLKNEEVHNLARELASLTGESMTAAVTEAVRERLDRVRSGHKTSLSERLLAIGRDCAQRLQEPGHSMDHGDFLYGEDGLPR